METVLVAALMVPFLWLQLWGIRAWIVLALGSLGIAIFVGPRGLREHVIQNSKWVALTLSYPVLAIVFDTLGTRHAGYSSTVLLYATVYALLLGMALASLAPRIGLARVTNAIFLTAAPLVFFSLYLVHTIGADRIVITAEGERYVYVEAFRKIIGLFGEPNILYWTVAMTIITACSVGILVLRTNLVFRVLHLAAIVGALYCNYATGTRTVFLGWIVTTFVVVGLLCLQPGLSVWKRARMVLLVAGFTIAFIAVVSRSGLVTDSFLIRLQAARHDTRIDIWTKSLTLIGDNPFGGEARMLSLQTYAHNHVLDAGLLYGWAGALAVGLIFAWVLFAALRATRRPLLGAEAMPLAAAVIGCVAVQMTFPPNVPVYVFTLAVGTFFQDLCGPSPGVAPAQRPLFRLSLMQRLPAAQAGGGQVGSKWRRRRGRPIWRPQTRAVVTLHRRRSVKLYQSRRDWAPRGP